MMSPNANLAYYALWFARDGEARRAMGERRGAQGREPRIVRRRHLAPGEVKPAQVLEVVD